jgi:endonuclease IV
MNIGIHCHKKDETKSGYTSCMETMKIFNMKVFQIFVMNPHSSALNNLGELNKKYIKDNKIRLYVHGSYVHNPWKKNKFAIHNIREQLRICDCLNGKGVVIHLPKKNIKCIVEGIEAIYKDWKNPSKCRLFLESNQSKPDDTTTFETPEKMAKLINTLSKSKYAPHIAFCLDTAHIYATGADLSSKELVATYFSKLEKLCNENIYMIKLIHLNDTTTKLGCGRDIHTYVGDGEIWKNDCGYKVILDWTKKNGIDIILERNNFDFSKIKKEIQLLI